MNNSSFPKTILSAFCRISVAVASSRSTSAKSCGWKPQPHAFASLHRSLLSNILLSLPFIAWLTISSSQASDFLGQSSLIDVLPASTQLVVTSQSVKSSYALLERSEACKQLSGPTWKSVMAKQASAKVGSILNPKPWLGLEWQDISQIEQTGAVAAFLDGNGETAIVFLAKLGPNPEKHPFVERWIANQGGMSQLQAVPGTEPTKFFTTKGDAKSGTATCIALGSQWICISSSGKAVQQWLSNPSFKSMKAASAPSSNQPVFADGKWGIGETRFWLSPWAIINGYAKQEPKLVKSAKQFGLEGMLALSGTLTPPAANENAWRLTYNQQIVSPPTKGMAIFSFKKGGMVDAPAIFNDSMDQVSISYLDMKPWFQGVSHALDQAIDEDTPGSFGDLVDSILTDPEGPKIDVRKELIYPSGPLMIQFGVTAPEKKKPGQFQHNQVWALSIPDSKKVASTISKLFENDKDIKNEQIGPYQVWSTVNDESLFVAVKQGETQAISIAAVDNKYLYMATDTAWLKGLLAGGKGAAGDATRPALWKSHLQKIPSPNFSFQQAIYLGSWFECSWARLPEPTHKEYISTDLASYCLSKALIPGCTAADVPKWNQVQSVFGIITQTATQSERGIDGQVLLYAK